MIASVSPTNAAKRIRMARLLKLAKRRLPKQLAAYRRRKEAAALRAKRPQPSRRERHLARIAARQFAEEERRALIDSLKPTIEA